MRELILEKLKQIEKDHHVKILLAIESGSRAWGFASPDSDYDVRFIYVGSKNDYLRLDERRDVIELPINEELDINGWDLPKALRLFYKSNPTLFEWLRLYRFRICRSIKSRKRQVFFIQKESVPLHQHGTRQLPRISERRYGASKEVSLRAPTGSCLQMDPEKQDTTAHALLGADESGIASGTYKGR